MPLWRHSGRYACPRQPPSRPSWTQPHFPPTAAPCTFHQFCAADLCRLELRSTGLTAIPPALSAATALTFLSFDLSLDLRLSEAGIDTLCALPHLQELRLLCTEASSSPLLQQLQLRLPHSRIVSDTRHDAPANRSDSSDSD